LNEDGGASAALALERAQIGMLRSGTWRSLPKYWAAYLITGKG
jgi:CHAT domain-containing protein